MPCYGKTDYKEDEIDGECEECGQPTVSGQPYNSCCYSSTQCKKCGWSPCDLYCSFLFPF